MLFGQRVLTEMRESIHSIGVQTQVSGLLLTSSNPRPHDVHTVIINQSPKNHQSKSANSSWMN